jgi:hypothetical protein
VRLMGLIAVLSTLALPFDASAGPTVRFATHSRLTTREVRAIVETAGFRITLTVAPPHTDPRFNALILLKDSPQLAAEVAIQVRPSAAATRAFISMVETTAPPDPPVNPLGHRIAEPFQPVSTTHHRAAKRTEKDARRDLRLPVQGRRRAQATLHIDHIARIRGLNENRRTRPIETSEPSRYE